MSEVIKFILTAAQLISAISVIVGVCYALYRWVHKQNKQDEDIKQLNEDIKHFKDEQALICYGVLAALKGLKEQGCNGPVTEAINKIDKHLNLQAHR